MIQDRNGQYCSWTNQWRANRNAHMAIHWFLWFWLRACQNWMQMLHHGQMVIVSHLPVLEYTDVDHCGLMSLNDLYQTPWSVTNVKTILLKTRKSFSCRALSAGIVPIHGANFSGCLRCPSVKLKEKNMSEMFQFLHLALHFLASTAPLTIFKWQNFNM